MANKYGIPILSAGLSSIGDWISSRIEDRRAEKQHERTKELMSLQNDYQVAQWQRENDYNSPSAVAERFRNAGINPRAVFGSGTQGAGVAGGLSSPPSASAPAAMSTNAFSGLGSSFLSGVNTESQLQVSQSTVREKNANILKSLEQRKALAIENKYLERKNITELEARKADTEGKLAKAKKDSAEEKRLLAEINQIEQDIKKSQKEIEEIDKNMAYIDQKINESRSIENVNNQRVNNLRLEGDLLRAEIELTNNKAETEKLDQALKQAQKGHYEALQKQVEKEIEFLASKTQLNKQQVEYLKHKVYLDWAQFTATAIKMTSEEFRKWLIGWIPGTMKDAPSTFNVSSYDSNDFPIFAD